MDILFLGRLPHHQSGNAIISAEIVAGLVSLGYRGRYLAPATVSEAAMMVSTLSSETDVPVIHFRVPDYRITVNDPGPETFRARQAIQIARNLEERFQRRRPDVLFIVGGEYFLQGALKTARAHSVPTLLLTHGAACPILEGQFPADARREIISEFPKIDIIVACAAHIAELLQRHSLRNIAVVPNGVDSERFRPRPKNFAMMQRLRIGTTDLMVGFLSALVAGKRPLDLVALAYRMRRHHPNAIYLVVGDGPCRAEMEMACRASGVIEHFRFVNWVDHQQVPDYFNLCDIIIPPSASEGMSLMHLEAQACAKPLLASNIPGAQEVIRDGETGLLFPLGAVGTLAELVTAVARERSLRKRLGERARRAIIEQHALKDIAQSYSRLMASLEPSKRGS